MIWTAERNRQQGALVAAMYHELAAEVLGERKAVLAGGLPELAPAMRSVRLASTPPDT